MNGRGARLKDERLLPTRDWVAIRFLFGTGSGLSGHPGARGSRLVGRAHALGASKLEPSEVQTRGTATWRHRMKRIATVIASLTLIATAQAQQKKRVGVM